MVNKPHTDTASRHGSPFVPLLLPDRSIEGGGRADHGFALQMRCANVANAHNVVVMSSQRARKDNLQIGSLQIDVHEPQEPPVRLSHAVIITQPRDLHPELACKSVKTLLHRSETRSQLRVEDHVPTCRFTVWYCSVNLFATAVPTVPTYIPLSQI